MALHDLTPQLRTRLSRVEKTVGWFLGFAVLLFFLGFGFYVFHVAKTKGWFKAKAYYYTYTRTATGMKVGDPVKLMGLNVGEITLIDPTPADDFNHDMYVEFRIWEPYYGYLWSDSKVRLNSGDFLGNRFLEVTRGRTGKATYNLGKDLSPVAILVTLKDSQIYKPVVQNSKFELMMVESESLPEELTRMVGVVKEALPGVLSLTNQIHQVLTNAVRLTANLNGTVEGLKPSLAHLQLITEGLTNRQGSLGEWLIPTNLNQRVEVALDKVGGTLDKADKTVGETDLLIVQTRQDLHQALTNLLPVLENLAGMTSNLHSQVQANTNMLAGISAAVIHADDLLQGLKRHWLLRSAFKAERTNAPARRPAPPKPGLQPRKN